MAVQFNFKGGTFPMPQGASAKFLLFLVNNGREISFFEALKNGMVSNVRASNLSSYDPSLYETECRVMKVFLHEHRFGSARLTQGFYLLLGQGAEGQTVEIRPREAEPRAAGYHFRAKARFLKKNEALRLFKEGSLPYRMLLRQQLPPVEVLRSIINITRPRLVEQDRAVRALRIRET